MYLMKGGEKKLGGIETYTIRKASSTYMLDKVNSSIKILKFFKEVTKMTRFTRKVIAFVVTIALVVTTMGTVFATDNSATYQESANMLKSYGVLVGDNGNLMLDQPLLRQDAVIISLRLMGIADEEFENYEIPSDFNDISNSYYLPIIGMAQDLGLIEGMGDGTFGFNQKITTQQIETILLRALGYEITDDIYADVPQMAAELGISNLVTAANDEYLTRDKVAQLMLNTLNTPVKGESQKLGEKLGFMQSAALSFTAAALTETSFKVSFNGAVADTAAATFGVKKDDVTVNISSTAWNSAKTEATLTMVSKLSEGDYVITVSGIQLSAATATVAVEDEETGKIEFLTDKAILADSTDDADDDVITLISKLITNITKILQKM
jgi:preprotein translocase subunit YajC